jgi:hypothetical protein
VVPFALCSRRFLEFWVALPWSPPRQRRGSPAFRWGRAICASGFVLIHQRSVFRPVQLLCSRSTASAILRQACASSRHTRERSGLLDELHRSTRRSEFRQFLGFQLVIRATAVRPARSTVWPSSAAKWRITWWQKAAFSASEKNGAPYHWQL